MKTGSNLFLQKKLNNNLNNLLGVSRPDKIAIAVSGGVDSVALMCLLVNWAHVYKVQVTIFSVNHNLRPEAAQEIAYVENLSKKLGFNFVALNWHGSDKKTALQERAREGRYNLITSYCQKLGISVLLTAHHLDDNLETYLIKKSRKAGALSLRPNISYFWDNIWVLRPLFNIEKFELVDYLLKNNIKWFEDASNDSDKYERNRIRKQLRLLSSEERSILLQDYNKAITKADILNELFIKSVAEVISIYKEGFAKINLEKFNNNVLLGLDSGMHNEIKIHLLNYILTIISGKTLVPRYRNLEKIITSIAANTFKSATLSYCRLVSAKSELVIYKEKAFVEGEAISATWDKRFDIIKLPPDCYISNLTMADYRELKKLLNLEKLAKDSNNNHKSILFTLPVLKNLEKVVAIPHISYYSTNNMEPTVKVTFNPNFISRFTHFF